MKVMGLMSGTSVDGIDAAVCEFNVCGDSPMGWTMELLGYREQPFPCALREHLLDLLRRQSVALDDLTELNFMLGAAFADAAVDARESIGLRPRDIDLVASHGQTIYHLVAPGRCRSTLQMGEPTLIASRMGVTVVADFRVADMAVGGEGAPLVSYFDACFFGGSASTRAIQNIGGVANVTFLPAGSVPDAAYAFDTGPGNALIDYGARYFSAGAESCDRDSVLASLGRIHQDIVERVLQHAYFAQPPPKTTGREIFGDSFAAAIIAEAAGRQVKSVDIMATLTAITAESIARAYRAFGPPTIQEVILSGGGAQNPTLVTQLQERLPKITFRHQDEFEIPSNAKEAVAFAVLGYEALHGRHANLPGCTGALRSTVLGKITPGDNYEELMRLVFSEQIRELKKCDL